VPDIFISHASEDKEPIARPLAEALKKQGCNVWFDETTLRLGDSLRREIDRGLAACNFGVVILSPAFFGKEWPQRELDGLVSRETAERAKRVLPVWHNVSAEDVARFSPTLADRLGISTARGLDVVVHAILDAAVPTSSAVSTNVVSLALPRGKSIPAQGRTALFVLLGLLAIATIWLWPSDRSLVDHNQPTTLSPRTLTSTTTTPANVTQTSPAISLSGPAKPAEMASEASNVDQLPRLFILSIGINDYGHPASNRRSAVASARAMATLFARQKGKNFSDVRSLIITESQATRAKVAKALQAWAKEATPDDLAILFLSGRSGVFDVGNEPGRYSFVCFDTDQRDSERTGIPGRMILDVSANLACPKIVLIDTPTNAGIHPQLPSDVTSTTENRKLPALAIMQASWNGGTPETEYGQSMFAKALLDGLGFAADANHDDVVTFSELWAYMLLHSSRDAALTTPHEFREINFSTVLVRRAAP
jgi:hypothetical protein